MLGIGCVILLWHVYLFTEIYMVSQGYSSVCESHFIWVGGFHKRSMSSANYDLDFAPGEYSNQHEYLPSLIRDLIVRCRKTFISQVADQTGRKLGSNPSLPMMHKAQVVGFVTQRFRRRYPHCVDS